MPSLGLPIYGQQGRGLSARRWRTLEEREGRAEAAGGEFPEGAQEAPAGVSRRSFLQVLGASAALAGLEACQPPRERLVPYVRAPAAVTPSVPAAYATAASGVGFGDAAGQTRDTVASPARSAFPFVRTRALPCFSSRRAATCGFRAGH